jgi:hypothetical protein
MPGKQRCISQKYVWASIGISGDSPVTDDGDRIAEQVDLLDMMCREENRGTVLALTSRNAMGWAAHNRLPLEASKFRGHIMDLSRRPSTLNFR